ERASPPASPTVPYTTLFRSLFAGRKLDSARYSARSDWKSNEYDEKSRGERDDSYIKLAFRDTDDVLDEEWEKISLLVFKPIFSADRKSTRLNSSHVSISYAV